MRSRSLALLATSAILSLGACRAADPTARTAQAVCATTSSGTSSTSGAGGSSCAPTPQCSQDSDCGGPTSGKACVDSQCVAGCRGVSGNACPANQICSSIDAVVGTCSPIEMSSSSGGVSSGDADVIGGGCSLTPAAPGDSFALLALTAGALTLSRRRRARS